MAKVNPIPIPFDKHGHMMGWTDAKLTPADIVELDSSGSVTIRPYGPDRDHGLTVFKRNTEFEDTLTYVSHTRGCSSVKIIFNTSAGDPVEMFITDLTDIMNSGGFDGNRVSGVFTYCKRGQNYGIRRVRQDE